MPTAILVVDIATLFLTAVAVLLYGFHALISARRDLEIQAMADEEPFVENDPRLRGVLPPGDI